MADDPTRISPGTRHCCGARTALTVPASGRAATARPAQCIPLTTNVAGWLRCATSCVAGFQGEGAEEEGAGGPPGNDAEALPGSERAVSITTLVSCFSSPSGPVRDNSCSRARRTSSSAASCSAVGSGFFFVTGPSVSVITAPFLLITTLSDQCRKHLYCTDPTS